MTQAAITQGQRQEINLQHDLHHKQPKTKKNDIGDI